MIKFIKSAWVESTVAQRITVTAIIVAVVYMTSLFVPLILDGDAELTHRILGVMWLILFLQISFYLMVQMYKRFLNILFRHFSQEAKNAGTEAEFMDALLPRPFELLLEQTVLRNGFSGLIRARNSIDITSTE